MSGDKLLFGDVDGWKRVIDQDKKAERERVREFENSFTSEDADRLVEAGIIPPFDFEQQTSDEFLSEAGRAAIEGVLERRHIPGVDTGNDGGRNA